MDVRKDVFFADEMLQSAILQKLGVIGEAASKLSPELRSRYPEIDWKSIIGTRNILIHAYFSLNWEIIWVAATEQVNPLSDRIREILSTEYPNPEIDDKN